MATFTGAGAALGTTSATTVFTASAVTVVKGIHCANKSGAATTVTVEWVDDSASAAFHLAHQHSVPANSAHQVLDAPLVLASGDTIRVTAGDSGALDVTVSALVP